MHRQTVFLFASNPRIGNSILRNARAFSRKFTRTISPRWPLTNASRCFAAACAVASLLFGGGCEYMRQELPNQPKNAPLAPSEFFGDGRSERPPVRHSLPRGAPA